MSLVLIIAIMISPALLMYKHNRQAENMLAGRLYKMDVNQDIAYIVFKKEKRLFVTNTIIVLGFNISFVSGYIYYRHEISAFAVTFFIGIAIVIYYSFCKIKIISDIHKSVLGR